MSEPETSSIPETSPINAGRLIDLTYALEDGVVYWPGDPAFRRDARIHPATGDQPWCCSGSISGSEHVGTHLDAPVHFAEGQSTINQVPLDRLIAPGVCISVASLASGSRVPPSGAYSSAANSFNDPDYLVTRADIETWEAAHHPIAPRSIVLLHTGWGRHWQDRNRYFGTSDRNPHLPPDPINDLSNAPTNDLANDPELHFPGIAPDAATLLASDRGVVLVGIDTPSLDPGRSRDFPAHRILNAAGILGAENLANLDRLPDTGFLVLALPLKIAGGSGAPARVVAILDA